MESNFNKNRNYRDQKPRGGYGQRRPDFRNQRKPSLPPGFNMFYIAILCPEEVNEYVDGFKDRIENEFGSRAAKKSPAHITIIPPFRAEEEMEPILLSFVQEHNMGIVPFEISVNDFGHFAERVVYVHVEETESLSRLEEESNLEFSRRYPSILFGHKPPFKPHITLATRDIPEGRFDQLYEMVTAEPKPDFKFEASRLTLMKLEQGKWVAC